MVERYTAYHHLRAAAGQGAVAGVLVLNEYVARKHLGATRWQILALMMIPAAAQLVVVVWNPASAPGPLGRRPFRTFGTALHALLLLPLLTGGGWGPWAFVALAATVLVAEMLLVPLQNAVLARNYGDAVRGRRFGSAVSLQSLLLVCVSVPLGILLDHRPGAWPVGYALAAGAAIYAYRHWGRLRRRRPAPVAAGLESHASAWQVLRRDGTFRAFEGCFMVYGLGFLALQPVLVLYFADEVAVSYTDVGLARGAVFWLVMVLAAPRMGRLGDRIGILRLAALGFLCLALFPLSLRVLPDRAGLFVGYAIFGLAMSAVNVAWNLGPIAMARGRDPIPYLNAHVAAVGLRAVVGMTAATALQETLGSRAVFLGVAVLEVLAAGLMFWTARITGRRWRIPAAPTSVAAP
jgi:Na+/melibiose symporter-like transporter